MSLQQINEWRNERAKLAAEARKLTDTASTEKRELSKEENEKFDKIMSDVDKIKADIDREERLLQVESETTSQGESRTGRNGTNTVPGQQQEQRAEPFKFELRGRSYEFGIDTHEYRRSQAEYAKGFRSYLQGGFAAIQPLEGRAYQADSDIEGGYLVAPTQTQMELLKFLDDQVHIRQFSRVLPTLTSAQSLGVPTLDTDVSDADWTVELGTGNEDTSARFGRRELKPHPLAKRVKLSATLLRRAAMNPEALMRERLGYKFALTQEKAFLTGTGAGQPLGLFTASTDGITTARDVSTDNTTTSVTADGLINALYSLKGGYQSRSTWMFHRDVVKQIRKLKNGDGQYLWAPGLAGGEPDTILQRPFIMSEFAPNTLTTGQYVGIVGDFDYYWIVDALGMTVQRLVELYAETNQVGLIGRMETDAQPVLAEAFARVKLA